MTGLYPDFLIDQCGEASSYLSWEFQSVTRKIASGFRFTAVAGDSTGFHPPKFPITCCYGRKIAPGALHPCNAAAEMSPAQNYDLTSQSHSGGISTRFGSDASTSDWCGCRRSRSPRRWGFAWLSYRLKNSSCLDMPDPPIMNNRSDP